MPKTNWSSPILERKLLTWIPKKKLWNLMIWSNKLKIWRGNKLEIMMGNRVISHKGNKSKSNPRQTLVWVKQIINNNFKIMNRTCKITISKLLEVWTTRCKTIKWWRIRILIVNNLTKNAEQLLNKLKKDLLIWHQLWWMMKDQIT